MELRQRGPDSLLLGPVALDREQPHVRRLGAVAERPERALIRLIGRIARDRELLQPAGGDLLGRERAEDRQHDPGADDGLAMVDDEAGETLEHRVRRYQALFRAAAAFA